LAGIFDDVVNLVATEQDGFRAPRRVRLSRALEARSNGRSFGFSPISTNEAPPLIQSEPIML
jgi:hypothetical protein